MVSSVRAGMIAQEKQKKIQRRILKQIKDDMDSSFISVDSFNNKNQKREEEVKNAVEERIEPEDNQQEHTQVEEREVPTETSDSDSIVESGKVKAEIKKTTKKGRPKKATKKE